MTLERFPKVKYRWLSASSNFLVDADLKHWQKLFPTCSKIVEMEAWFKNKKSVHILMISKQIGESIKK